MAPAEEIVLELRGAQHLARRRRLLRGASVAASTTHLTVVGECREASQGGQGEICST
jgi:hypothetical protein